VTGGLYPRCPYCGGRVPTLDALLTHRVRRCVGGDREYEWLRTVDRAVSVRRHAAAEPSRFAHRGDGS
jgi:hypothetical protein